MIRYLYAREMTPPAPFVKVSVRCSSTGREAVGLLAQLDTAADRTLLPQAVVDALGLAEDGRLLFQGFGSAVVELPTYLVAVGVHDLPRVKTRAVLGASEPYILLGRDVANAYRFLLDGPSLALEIG